MTVHHLNCASLDPACGWLYASRGAPPGLVCHCLLVETRHGLVLVDTGLGTREVADRASLGRSFRWSMRPRLDGGETALAQVQARGYQARDVQHIVVTHLDLDHAGGLADFPHATVHVHHAEHAAAHRPTWRERLRYLPAQWAHQPRWQLHRPEGEGWLGLGSVCAIPGLDDDILLVPLPGHTRGHSAVAVRQPGGWLVHAGDAYFSRHELATPRRCPPGLRMLQTLVEVDRRQRFANQARLRTLAAERAGEVTLFCAHDPAELAALQAASAAVTRAAGHAGDARRGEVTSAPGPGRR
jgi:glyoxylase-like metal-dependent hydrolase (beta-lactamase superfamily II)